TLLRLVILHQRLAETLDDGALDLALDAARVDGAADVVDRPHAEDLHLAGHGIDLDLGHLGAEDIDLPRRAGAVHRVETGTMRGEGAGAHRHDAAALADVDRLFHRHALVGAAGPDLAVEGLDQVDVDPPVIGDLGVEPLARVAASEGHRVADHVGLAGGAGMGGLGRARRVVVADRHLFGPDAELLGGHLGENGEDALTDLGDTGQALGGAAVVVLDPGTGPVDRRRLGDAVPGSGHSAAAGVAGHQATSCLDSSASGILKRAPSVQGLRVSGPPRSLRVAPRLVGAPRSQRQNSSATRSTSSIEQVSSIWPVWVVEPIFIMLRRRISNGSRPSFSAQRSRWLSVANWVCIAPKLRKAPDGVLLV